MNVVIAAAGTGGHVIPALTMAEKFTQKGYKVHWVGTKSGIESKLVPAAGYELTALPKITGLRGKSLIFWLLAPFRIFNSILFSVWTLLKLRPKFVLAMGGYVSGPVGIAAWLLRIPLVLHEQNAIAGTANTILSRFASKILQAYPNSFKNKTKKILTVGNPVRYEIASISKGYAAKDSLNVLVIGGSLGAKDINTAIINYVKDFHSEQVSIVHQTGINDHQRVLANTKNIIGSERYRAVAYIDSMQESYKWADIIVSRAGAMSVAEIIQVGIPCILVPFPFAVDDHQTHNAKEVAEAGAGLMVKQSEFTAAYLNEHLENIINDKSALEKMSLAMQKLKRPNVVDDIAYECEAFC